MLKVPPTNLNKQSQDATIQLIREVLQRGIQLTDVYVDALGNTSSYEAYLSSLFQGINFTVATKADSKFKIVGAASVAAKVTRDTCIEEWCFEELGDDESTLKGFARDFGSGYPAGWQFRCQRSPRMNVLPV
jgi:ribonuclease H2 subunit A